MLALDEVAGRVGVSNAAPIAVVVSVVEGVPEDGENVKDIVEVPKREAFDVDDEEVVSEVSDGVDVESSLGTVAESDVLGAACGSTTVRVAVTGVAVCELVVGD